MKVEYELPFIMDTTYLKCGKKIIYLKCGEEVVGICSEPKCVTTGICDNKEKLND